MHTLFISEYIPEKLTCYPSVVLGPTKNCKYILGRYVEKFTLDLEKYSM
jgi:hypothetical protein